MTTSSAPCLRLHSGYAPTRSPQICRKEINDNISEHEEWEPVRGAWSFGPSGGELCISLFPVDQHGCLWIAHVMSASQLRGGVWRPLSCVASCGAAILGLNSEPRIRYARSCMLVQPHRHVLRVTDATCRPTRLMLQNRDPEIFNMDRIRVGETMSWRNCRRRA